MTFKLAFRRWRAAVSVVGAMATLLPIANASNSWGNYHWERSKNPFTLKLGDNVSSAWDLYFGYVSVDWSQSTVLDTAIVTGGTDPRKCRATSGRVEVCNAGYGKNGWLGLASIWASGNHIVQATVKMNDSYFNSSLYNYNTPAWRQSVLCQEVGHIFGLDHQDENFNTDGDSCMDYSNIPPLHPNQHDYDQLMTIYSHTDASTSLTSDAGGKGKSGELPSGFTGLELDGPGQWGRQVASFHNGEEDVFEADFGGGNRIITFVRRAN